MTRRIDELSKADYETLAQFRRNLRRFLHFSEDAADAVGLTPQQYLALLFIKGQPERDHLSVGELADWLQIRHHSTVGLVNRLEAQGMVERRPSQIDRRRVDLFLTQRGSLALGQLAHTHREELRLLEPELTASLQKAVLKRPSTGNAVRRPKPDYDAIAQIA